MDTNYLEEAFKRLSLLEDDFDITADADKIDELKSFVADDVEEIPEEEIIDVNAETEEELSDNYIGKVILECECCHSRIYKDEEDVIIDDESGLANIDEQCPVCNNELGYTVIGKIEPFDADREIKPEDEEELPEDDVEVEEEETEEEVEESLKNRSRKHSFKEGLRDRINRKIRESSESDAEKLDKFIGPNTNKPKSKSKDKPSKDASENVKKLDKFINEDKGVCPNCGKEPCECNEGCEELTEGIENLSLETDDQHIELHSTEDGGVSLTTEPVENANEDWQEPGGDLLPELDEEEPGEEEIVPLDAEEEANIEANEPEEEVEETEEETVEEEPIEEEPVEGEEESEEGEEEVDVEDFDEETFDEMGESYMRKIYGNVSNYKTTKLVENKGNIVVEGLITFNSGATKKTNFVFGNASFSKRGKLVFEGYNKTFSKSDRAFMLRGNVKNKKYIPESLIYNYKVKQLNESTNSNEVIRVYGRIKKRK